MIIGDDEINKLIALSEAIPVGSDERFITAAHSFLSQYEESAISENNHFSTLFKSYIGITEGENNALLVVFSGFAAYRDVLTEKLSISGERPPNIEDYGVSLICRIGLYLILIGVHGKPELLEIVDQDDGSIMHMSAQLSAHNDVRKIIASIVVLETGTINVSDRADLRIHVERRISSIYRGIAEDLSEEIRSCETWKGNLELISAGTAIAAAVPGIGPIAATILSIGSAKGASQMEELINDLKNIKRQYIATLTRVVDSRV